MKALLLIFLAIALTTCTKFGRTITVKGRVLNPITGEGVEGIKIQLVKSQSFKLPGGYKEVKSTTSDANGNFEINKSGFNHYSIQAQFVDYPIGWFVDGEFKGDFRMPVKVGKKITADYHTVPYGSLKMHIENVNCEGASDIMVFRRKGQFDLDYDSYSTERLGCYVFTSTNGSEIHSGYHYFETKVIRSSGTTYYYDTVFVPGNGVGIGEILY